MKPETIGYELGSYLEKVERRINKHQKEIESLKHIIKMLIEIKKPEEGYQYQPQVEIFKSPTLNDDLTIREETEE